MNVSSCGWGFNQWIHIFGLRSFLFMKLITLSKSFVLNRSVFFFMRQNFLWLWRRSLHSIKLYFTIPDASHENFGSHSCFTIKELTWSRAIGLMSKVFTDGLRDHGFNSRSSHIEDSKMVLDTALLNTYHYEVRIIGKVEQSKEWSNALPYTSVL